MAAKVSFELYSLKIYLPFFSFFFFFLSNNLKNSTWEGMNISVRV